jgi:hypothetical protein
MTRWRLLFALVSTAGSCDKVNDEKFPDSVLTCEDAIGS